MKRRQNEWTGTIIHIDKVKIHLAMRRVTCLSSRPLQNSVSSYKASVTWAILAPDPHPKYLNEKRDVPEIVWMGENTYMMKCRLAYSLYTAALQGIWVSFINGVNVSSCRGFLQA